MAVEVVEASEVAEEAIITRSFDGTGVMQLEIRPNLRMYVFCQLSSCTMINV